ADARSDLYSLGCALYHMLAGAPPFSEGSIVERLTRHAQEAPADLRELNRLVPDELWAICRRLLEKRPADRYPCAAELLADLCLQRTIYDSQPLGKPHASEVSSGFLQTARATMDGSGHLTASHGEEHRIAQGQFNAGVRAIATGE